MAVVNFTGSGDICGQPSIKSKHFGFITVSLTAEEISGLDCSLQLTDLPQHTLIEFSVNSYLTPYPCFCTNEFGNQDYCNFVQVSGLAQVKNLCLNASTNSYVYTNDKKSITFTPHFKKPTLGLQFNITYKG